MLFIPEEKRAKGIESLISENKSLRNRLTQRQLDDSLNNDDWGDDSDHA